MATLYGHYVQTFLQIDEDNNGLFVLVPGMSENWFKVRVDESGVCPKSTHCKCSKFAHKGTCEHCQIVDAFYAKLYKSNVEKAEIKALETLMDASDAIEQVYEEVAFVEQVLAATEKDQTPLIVTTPAQPDVTFSELVALDDQMSLIVPRKVDYHSVVTANFFSNLPSRKPAA